MSKIAFIDLENTLVNNIDLRDFDAIYVFRGALQQQCAVRLNGYKGKIHIFDVPDCGKNNLDFHLTLQLGRFHEMLSVGTDFVVFSGDKGFDGIINYLSEMGRNITRVNPRMKKIHTGASLEILINSLKAKTLPRTLPKLANAIGSQLCIYDDPKSIDKELDYLKAHHFIKVGKSQQVTYHLN